MTNWDKRFMDMAKHVASWSKDRKKKVGAVIVDEDNRVISMGYNGFVSGAKDEIEERHIKPLKLFYVVHAEVNALCSANRSGIKTKNATIFVTFHVCSECAKSIIQSGIKRVVCYEVDFEKDSWGQTSKIAKEMFEEVGIELIYWKD